MFAGPGNATMVVAATGSIAAVYTPDGRLRWGNQEPENCGNCTSWGNPIELRSDGTVGPLGPQTGTWAASWSGKITRPGCVGTVLPGGMCVTHIAESFENPLVTPGVQATLAGVPQWKYSRPDLRFGWDPYLGSPPPIAVGDRQTAYTTVTTSTGGRLVAIDAATGAERWSVATPGWVTGADPHGVITWDWATGLVAWDRDGRAMWTYPEASGPTFRGIVIDPTGRLVAINFSPSYRQRRVVALDRVTGRLDWSSPTTDNVRVISVTANGTPLASINRAGRVGLRALGTDGRSLWQFDTTSEVVGAAELADGTVAVSTTEVGFQTELGLLWRIDPRLPARRIQGTSYVLRSTPVQITPNCLPGTDAIVCPFGATLRTRLAQPADVAIGIRCSAAAPRLMRVRLPAGTNALRSTWWTCPKASSGTIVVRRGMKGPVLARLPVRFVR